jgi:hypothetical protein
MNTSSKIIHIRSSDRQNKEGSSSDIFFSLKETLSSHSDNEFITLSVQNAQIPISFYNISNLYNYLDIRENDVTFSIQIQSGNYNIYQFINALTSLLNNNSPNLLTYTLTYSTIRNKITIKHNDSDITTTLLFQSGSNAYRDIGPLLGCVDDFNVYNYDLELPNTVNMMPTNSLYIRTSLSSKNAIATRVNGYTDILSKIPINSPPNTVLFYQNITFYKINTNISQLSYINIRLTDEDNDLIDLNGQEWSCSLQVDFYTLNKPTISDTIEIPDELMKQMSQQEQEQQQQFLDNETDEES